MSMNEHFQFLSKNKIPDGLLREFVGKGLWSPAIVACDAGIDKRLAEVEKLRLLRERLNDEISLVEEM